MRGTKPHEKIYEPLFAMIWPACVVVVSKVFHRPTHVLNTGSGNERYVILYFANSD